jgi:hypothetical protein
LYEKGEKEEEGTLRTLIQGACFFRVQDYKVFLQKTFLESMKNVHIVADKPPCSRIHH